MSLLRSYRARSVDILRGIVMIIMALDHTRDYFHVTAMTADPLNAATTSPALYFTRWVTHFCAPVFVFLSGLSAYLSSQKKSPGEAAGGLVKRGLWLVFVEIAIITMGLTFNPHYGFIILQVIWAISWSMVLLGIFSRISFRLVLVTGILLCCGHNITDLLKLPQAGAAGNWWHLLLTARGTVIVLSPTHLVGDFYAILPWTGIMFLGYCTGTLYRESYPAEKRQRLIRSAGFALIALFFVLRFINVYGDPVPWQKQDSFLKTLYVFFDVSKYPPSLMYDCITLGSALVLLSLLEQVRGKWAAVAEVYGSVPFFYYVLHFYLLHTLLVVVFFATGHSADQIANVPFYFRPQQFGFSLPVVYLIWIAVVASLYYPCRWFRRYKQEHRQWWLRYV
ncbi:DUF1624 domain-containing protein [Chitinophaga vietnamensis]|uniref:DUF1624 domain-containing protein n=1 Tax=Chitinophaga vietnamensis TaxID=2593957 RepID=UPI001178C273|nr:heparan-alpha-glucosaminide N-acetyltransferase domain-containing protein [Chitinophaga vietnamensis]